MADHISGPRITLHRHDKRVRVYHGNTPLADTCDALELREEDYPHRQYFPKADVDMSRLSISSTVTHCPFKGDSTYYSLPNLPDIAWSYEHPSKK